MTYQEVQGRKSVTIQHGIDDKMLNFKFRLLAVALEPLRWLTRWYMRRTSVPRRSAAQALGRPPPLADMVNARTSPAVRVLQYFSWLLRGDAPRLVLVFGFNGTYSSFREWAENEPEELDMFRSVIGVGTCGTFVRQLQFVHEFALVVGCAGRL